MHSTTACCFAHASKMGKESQGHGGGETASGCGTSSSRAVFASTMGPGGRSKERQANDQSRTVGNSALSDGSQPYSASAARGSADLRALPASIQNQGWVSR